tara:strand:+ start:630 stop:884 length:255 start_codon:yes stop_codon:yes gene_type:complete
MIDVRNLKVGEYSMFKKLIQNKDGNSFEVHIINGIVYDWDMDELDRVVETCNSCKKVVREYYVESCPVKLQKTVDSCHMCNISH